MATVEEVLAKLRSKARPDQLAGMARYGMAVERRLGVAVPDMRRIAKETGKDHRLALELWQTGFAEARILASMVDVPAELGEEQMEAWVKDFDSWDVCDQVCMNLFEKTPLAWKKIRDWARREEEYVRRAAFALLACLAWHDKKAGDDWFIDMLPLIREQAGDRRNFVKKAVNWALRNIGKRNAHLHQIVLQFAQELQKSESPSARWIASDALRDLASRATQKKISA